ncbi:MAG: class I SAM-dependent methyltransferase, partial [Sphingomonadales bacterium]|nr:class I SAM-dependent methyltransferase [Sphingomonadales bacterium]
MNMDEDAYQAYRSVIVSPTLRSIWAEVYGDRFWPDLDPPWTQATIEDVRFVADRLGVDGTSRLVDLGCGSGCFLRFAARDLGRHIIGIDANPMAVRLAQERCAGLLDKISVRTGDIGETGFPPATFDGAGNLDVLLFVPDKEKVLREVARILKPGAHFAGTTFELRGAELGGVRAGFRCVSERLHGGRIRSWRPMRRRRGWRQLLEGV